MYHLSRRMLRRGVSIAAGVTFAASAAFPASFAVGDVFAAVGSAQVKVFTPTGALITTLNDGSGSTYTTGMVFDGSNNLYVTNFSTGTISKFDSSGALLNSSFFNGGLSLPESILVNKAGNFIVGGPSGPTVNQYAPAGGTPTVNYSVQGGNGTGGTDWTDLSSDQKTLLYDGEGSEILSYNLATKTQNAVFASGLPTSVLSSESLQADRWLATYWQPIAKTRFCSVAAELF